MGTKDETVWNVQNLTKYKGIVHAQIIQYFMICNLT